MRIPRYFGLHAEPSKMLRIIAALIPFIIVVALYWVASDARLAENAADKLLPSFSQMFDAIERAAFVPDRRTGDLILWTDTVASLSRLGAGLLISAMVGLFVGMNTGLFPGMKTTILPFVTFVSIIPPLAVLPILFISFGVGFEAKVMLIFLGTTFMITRDVYLATSKIPHEQITKALTLGATQLGVVYRVVLPQIFPRLIESVRLSLGAGWLFLIASEAIASTDGLGYRIFLVRRYLAMDTIIPYVLWITLLGFTLDLILRKFVEWRYPWYEKQSGK